MSRAAVEKLHQAARRGDVKAIEMLLDAGTQVDARLGRSGPTAFVEAVEFKQAAAAALLLRHGADPKARRSPRHVSALHSVVDANSVRLVKKLLRAGLDPNDRDNVLGAAALHFARSARAVELLVKAGAEPELLDKRGNPPMRYAQTLDATRRRIQVDVVVALHAAGARWLHDGLEAQFFESLTTKQLLTVVRGCEVPRLLASGVSLLTIAQAKGATEVTALLLSEHGLDPMEG